MCSTPAGRIISTARTLSAISGPSALFPGIMPHAKWRCATSFRGRPRDVTVPALLERYHNRLCEHRDVVAAILHPDPRFSAPPRQVVVHLPWFMELRLATADGQSIAADKIAEQEEVLAIALSARTIAWEGKAGRVALKLRPRRNRLRSGLCAPAVACWCSYSHGRTRRAAARCFPDSRHRASRDARFRFSRKALPLRKSARLCVGGPGVREG